MLATLEETLKALPFPLEKKRLLVAYSGGVDSSALLWGLKELQPSFGYILGVAHVNHNLREDSQNDQAFCHKIAKSFGFPFYALEIPPQSLPRGESLEAWAREQRYALLLHCLEEHGYDYLVLGHTADDQVETFFLRLFRGTGLRGLRGMESCKGKLLRPLLSMTRQEILTFAEEKEIPFKEDPTNQDLRFTRNWLRHQLFPLLDKRFSLTWRKKVYQLMEDLQREEEALTFVARHYYENIWEKTPKDWRIHKKKFLSLPPAMQDRLVLGFLQEEFPEVPHSKNILYAFQNLLQSHFHGVKVWGETGLILSQNCDTIFMGLWKPYEMKLSPNPKALLSLPLGWGKMEVCKGKPPEDSLWVFPIPNEKEDLFVESWKRGLVTVDGKRVSRVFHRKGILPHWRWMWPLVTLNGKVVWIPGLWRWGGGKKEKTKLFVRWIDEESHAF